jgi:putative phosphoribosyl transferase
MNDLRSSDYERGVSITLGDVALAGNLYAPAQARGMVIFAHGSGSSRFSPRNRAVADVLTAAGFATLLFDLLTAPEEDAEMAGGMLRFDIALLAERLVAATQWVVANDETRGLHIGYFGASTGAAAALVAAAGLPDLIKAVVSRGGRPDLAGSALARVRAPTLLIVGGEDYPVIDMNREALDQLTCKKEMRIVPGATHLFEEPGTLEEVARYARDWFEDNLAGTPKEMRFHHTEAPGGRL